MKRCEYFLMYYCPGPAGSARLPIGLFLFDAAGPLLRFGLMRDWRRIRCLDPRADLGLLRELGAHMEQIVAESGAGIRNSLREQLLQWSERNLGPIRTQLPQGVETDNPEREFARLFREHVEPPRRPAGNAQRSGSRRWIHGQLLRGLERHDLLPHMQSGIPAAQFTAPGDGFRIDFSYRPDGVVKFLHAIALEHDWNQAKVLSFTLERIRQRHPAEMTAIVGDIPAPAAPNCAQLLVDSGIAVQPLSRLDGFLTQVRAELR